MWLQPGPLGSGEGKRGVVLENKLHHRGCYVFRQDHKTFLLTASCLLAKERVQTTPRSLQKEATPMTLGPQESVSGEPLVAAPTVPCRAQESRKRHPPSKGQASLVYIQIYANKNPAMNRVNGITNKIIEEELY